MGPEFGFDPAEHYRPERLLEHYERLSAQFESEIRDPNSLLRRITSAYAPDFDFNTEIYTADEAGRAELLWDVGNTLGTKTEGRPRWQVLEARDRPRLNATQAAYIQDLATYVGNRYPDATADGFHPNNLHLHQEFVHQPHAYKVTLVEGGASRQAEVRTDLAIISTTGDIIQTSAARRIPYARQKDGADGPMMAVTPEYRNIAAMLGLALADDETTADGQGQVGNVIAGQDTTEYDVFQAYNMRVYGRLRQQPGVAVPTVGAAALEAVSASKLEPMATGTGRVETATLDQRCARVDRFMDADGRPITLIEPRSSQAGKNASLIDGVRTYLTYLRDNQQLLQGTSLGVITNGQYVAKDELTVAGVLARDFPEVQGLHVIADETGKRSAELQLDEIGRLLRLLAKHLRSKPLP